MDKKTERCLRLAIAGYITCSAILSIDEDHPHVPHTEYNAPPFYLTTTVTVSGSILGNSLPDYITDVGASPINDEERAYKVDLSSVDIDSKDI